MEAFVLLIWEMFIEWHLCTRPSAKSYEEKNQEVLILPS